MGGPHVLRVHLLGGLEVEGVPVLALGSRKGRAVLRRLAVAAGAVVPADELVEAAWPEGAPVRAPDQLSVLVSRLRSVLGTARVLRHDAGYALAADWLDLADLDAARGDVRDALADGDAVRAMTRGREALAVVRGELLPEEDAPWAEDARTAARRTVEQLRQVTAEAALAAGATHECADLARTCLEADPYDESALRLLLQALAATGQVSSALATYQAATERLADELGVDPSPETRAVHLELLRRTTEPVVRGHGPAPVAGREGLVTALLTALEDVTTRSPALALVTGPAGMGKTTLLDEVAARAQGRAHVLRARGDAVVGDLPLQPVLDALALDLAGRRDLPELLAGEASLLAPLLGGATAGTPTTVAQALTSGSDRAALTAAVATLLSRLAGDAPLLLLVDDAHLLDPASTVLLHHLTRPAARLPLLVVAAARPGEGPQWRPGSTHELEPLSRADAVRLIGEDRADALWARSGGHPLFLVELARWEGALPDTVLTAVAQRCTRSDDLGVLRTAAVLGDAVDVDLLAGVLDLPVTVLLDHLDAAVQQRLLQATSTGYAFAHDLYRDALASLVTPARARVLHREAAQLLARRTGVEPGRLGHHALAGGDDALAAAALTAAAEVAAARYEHDQALSLLDRAVVLAPTPARRLQRARALLLTGRYDESEHEAKEAENPETAAAAQELRALAAYLRRDVDDALALATAAAAATSDPEQAAGCLALAGRILLGQGELDRAEATLREALALSTGQVRAIAAVWLSLTLSNRGDAVEAHTVITSPVTESVRALPLVEPHRCIALGRALAMLGRGAEALVVFDRLATTVEHQQVRRFAGRAENYRGWVLRNLGASAEADEATRTAWDKVQLLDDVAAAEARGHAVLDLADAALRAHDLDTAHAWLDRARTQELAPHVLKWRFDLRRDLGLGRLALADGDLDAAQAHAADVRHRAAALGVARFAVQADLLTAQARHRAGEPLDLDQVQATALTLPEVAPLESWWLLAGLARDLDEPRFARMAAGRVDALLPGAGPWADALKAAARQSLDGLPV
jgi:DNA-binding SARP family transcriptional activator